MKKKIILVSHGDLAKGMVHSAQMITGVQQNLFYYGLQPGEHPSQIFRKIKNEIESDKSGQIIIVVDVVGGSVCNHAMELLVFENVRLISGMTLSLIIELLISADFLNDEEIRGRVENAKQGIKMLSLEGQIMDDKEFFKL